MHIPGLPCLWLVVPTFAGSKHYQWVLPFTGPSPWHAIPLNLFRWTPATGVTVCSPLLQSLRTSSPRAPGIKCCELGGEHLSHLPLALPTPEIWEIEARYLLCSPVSPGPSADSGTVSLRTNTVSFPSSGFLF